MSYNDALRVAIANYLNDPRSGGRWSNSYALGESVVHPNDIVRIDVRWDSGERYDPTYGGSNDAPTFDIEVELEPAPGRPTVTRPKIDVSFAFTTLLNMLLETGL